MTTAREIILVLFVSESLSDVLSKVKKKFGEIWQILIIAEGNTLNRPNQVSRNRFDKRHAEILEETFDLINPEQGWTQGWLEFRGGNIQVKDSPLSGHHYVVITEGASFNLLIPFVVGVTETEDCSMEVYELDGDGDGDTWKCLHPKRKK